jgi:hypothetical protein
MGWVAVGPAAVKDQPGFVREMGATVPFPPHTFGHKRHAESDARSPSV